MAGPSWKYIDALFGNFRDAYTVLRGATTVLDANDTALVLNESDHLQLFLPENQAPTDRALAMVEIYNAMCRDKAGTVDKTGRPLMGNAPYQGFTQIHTLRMKARA